MSGQRQASALEAIRDVVRIAKAASSGVARNTQERIPRAERAIEALETLINASRAVVPFVQDEASRYADDGSNEPLEALRELNSALAGIQGAA